jgi:hypothetical protein
MTHGLHDGDGAEISLVLGSKRHHLRERARTRAEQRRLRVPAVHPAQVGARGHDHAHRRDRQHGNAERKGGKTLQGLRRHHGAERDADHDRNQPGERHWHMHRPAEQRRDCHPKQ